MLTGPEQVEGLVGSPGLDHMKAGIPQKLGDCETDDEFVLGDHDGGGQRK